MNCDSVSAGFHFWIGKMLAEAALVFGMFVVFVIFTVVLAYATRPRKRP
jgi:hypothetical protein